MKRSTFGFSAAAAALLFSGIAGAQVIPGNENDLQLQNGIDLIYIYTDPSIGPSVGSSGIADFATNDFFWRVDSKDTLRHCAGTVEITGFDIWDFDGDFTALEGGLNNTALADYYISKSDTTNPPANPGQIEPDQTDPNGVVLTFGAGGPKNNAFLTDPGCPPVGFITGYELEVDITGGAGVGAGIVVTADGVTDLCLTTFIPGAGHTYSGANTCADGNGDGSMPDGHSTDVGGAIGETAFDLIGGGQYSAFGGFGQAGALGGTDGVKEHASNFLEFAEPILAMNVNSSTGQGIEEGQAGVHYDCPPAAGGSLGARLYAWQGLTRPAAVMGTLAAPLPVCVNFKGGKLGLSPTDPLFNIFLGLWQGTVIQTDNGLPMTGTVFDDGTFTTLSLPLPGQVIPVGVTIPLSFQGFYKKTSGLVEGSQVTRWFMHG
jgi:hypothetical protein